MKKIKVISLAAAALLAISPVAELGLNNNTQTVQAASDEGTESNPYSLSAKVNSAGNDINIIVDGKENSQRVATQVGSRESESGSEIITTVGQISGLKPNQYYEYTDVNGETHVAKAGANGYLQVDGEIAAGSSGSHESSQTPSTSDNNEESSVKQPTSKETSKSETTTTPSQTVQKSSDTSKQVANNSEKSENSSKSTSATTPTSSSISEDNQKTVASSVTKTTKKAAKKSKYVRVYNARGKAIKKHGKYVLVKASATRHAKIVKIRGKKYYRIGKNKYVLVSNQKTKKHVRKARRSKKNVRRHVKRTRRSKKSKRVNKKR